MVQGDIHRLERGLLDLFPILKLFYAKWLVKYPLCMKLASGSINRFLEAKFPSVQTKLMATMMAFERLVTAWN